MRPHQCLNLVLGIVLIMSSAWLYAEELDLPELDVIATESAVSAEAHGNAVQFSGQTISQSGAVEVSDFLAQQGVVSVKGSSSISSQSNLSIRGFGDNANQNSLVLIDGIPDTSVSNVGPDLNVLLMRNIDDIAVQPGSYGVRYGDQAVGGVAAITTYQPDAPVRQLQVGGGNLSQGLVNFFASQRFANGVGASLGASSDQTDHTEPHQHQSHFILNGKVDYQGGQGSMTLATLGYHDQTQIPDAYQLGGSRITSSADNFNQITGALTYFKGDYFLLPDLEWQSDVANNVSHSQGVVNIPFTSGQNHWLWQNQLHYQEVLTLGQQLSYETYGLSNAAVNEQADEWDNSIFTDLTLPLTEQISLNAGMRYADQSIYANPSPTHHTARNEHVWVSTQGVAWQPVQSLKFYARRAGNYRLPKANEQMWTNQSDLPLNPQVGVSYEVGGDWQLHGGELKLSFYQLDLDNEIALNPAPETGTPFPIMSNLPPTRRYGLDAFAKLTMNAWLDFTLQASLVSPHFQSGQYAGKQIPSVSPVTASSTLTLHHGDWLAWVNETYNSRYYAANDLANIASTLPSYWLTNINIAKTWHELVFSIAMNNVFNQHYARFAYTTTPTHVNYYAGDGMSLMATVTVNFA